MSVDSLQALAVQYERDESEQAAEQEKSKPGYESAEDIRERCRERALWLVGGFEALLSKVKPEATQIVMDDKRCEKGVDAFTDVLMLHPNAEPPAWVLQYMPYFTLAVWGGSTLYAISEVDKRIQAEKAEQEQGGE